MSASRLTQLTLSSYGSPLRRPRVGWLIVAGLVVLVVFSAVQVAGFFDTSRPEMLSVLLQALLVAGLISLIPIAVLRWLDRREPEPWFMYALAFLWGGLIATGVSSTINSQVDHAVGSFVGATIGAPIVEETAKGLGLIVLLMLLRGEFDGPRDGFIYGVLIGMGFDWLATGVYIARGFEANGSVPWSTQIASRYALVGFSGHGLYTGLTGTFIGFALLYRSRLKQVAVGFVGFGLAVCNHAGWNLAGGLVTVVALQVLLLLLGTNVADVDNVDTLPIWLTWIASLFAALCVNFLGFVIILLGLRRSGQWEKRTMVEQLGPERGTPVVTNAEFASIQATAEPPRDKHGREIFHAQSNLAKRKAFLTLRGELVETDPVVQAWRAEVTALREPPAPGPVRAAAPA